MTNLTPYQEREIQFTLELIRKGHQDPATLRELLICTTSKTTCGLVEHYFADQHNDSNLLCSLVLIALEGEDSGDAPWAAANVLAEFPVELLVEHKASLVELSEHPWSYLHTPAKLALSRLAAHGA